MRLQKPTSLSCAKHTPPFNSAYILAWVHLDTGSPAEPEEWIQADSQLVSEEALPRSNWPPPPNVPELAEGVGPFRRFASGGSAFLKKGTSEAHRYKSNDEVGDSSSEQNMKRLRRDIPRLLFIVMCSSRFKNSSKGQGCWLICDNSSESRSKTLASAFSEATFAVYMHNQTHGAIAFLDYSDSRSQAFGGV